MAVLGIPALAALGSAAGTGAAAAAPAVAGATGAGLASAAVPAAAATGAGLGTAGATGAGLTAAALPAAASVGTPAFGSSTLGALFGSGAPAAASAAPSVASTSAPFFGAAQLPPGFQGPIIPTEGSGFLASTPEQAGVGGAGGGGFNFGKANELASTSFLAANAGSVVGKALGLGPPTQRAAPGSPPVGRGGGFTPVANMSIQQLSQLIAQRRAQQGSGRFV